MAVYQVQPNGQAPPGLSVGDYVNTYGNHLYQIAAPGSYGAVYNPASGYWSYDTQGEDYRIQSLINSAQSQAQQNTMQSQDFAREQMAFQNTSAQKAMNFSADQAALNREWQERLSNSAHQREVKDLIAAGLNPILSAGGSGATTPSGAAASGITSPGAQGSVDTGGTNAASQLLATLLNNQTQLRITELQTLATMYAADQGLIGTKYSSNMTYSGKMQDIKNSQYLAYMDFAKEDYMHREYPDTNHVLGSAINSLTHFLTRVFTGQNTGKDYDELMEAWAETGKQMAEYTKSGNVGPKPGILNYVFSDAYDKGRNLLKWYDDAAASNRARAKNMQFM